MLLSNNLACVSIYFLFAQIFPRRDNGRENEDPEAEKGPLPLGDRKSPVYGYNASTGLQDDYALYISQVRHTDAFPFLIPLVLARDTCRDTRPTPQYET